MKKIICSFLNSDFQNSKIGIKKYSYELKLDNNCKKIYPYLICPNCLNNNEYGYIASPLHGRSIIVDKIKDRYIILKGTGLTYGLNTFVQTAEHTSEALGLLLIEYAKRDFLIGMELESYGIITNKMEAIIEIDKEIEINSKILRPILLQYSVSSPFRLSDFPFIKKSYIKQRTNLWNNFSEKYKIKYEIAAERLYANLLFFHNNNILYNAVQYDNITWDLEFLDFEISRTPKFPYVEGEQEKYVDSLFSREIVHILEVIYFISWFLNEKYDINRVKDIFVNTYLIHIKNKDLQKIGKNIFGL